MLLLANEKNSGMLCIKYILVVFNFLFVVTGICLILVGWAINSIYFEYSHFLEAHFFSPGVLMICIGFLVFGVAFFGCWGAYRESTCMIMVFSVLLAFVFVLEVSAGVTGYILQGEVRGLLARTINTTFSEYYNDPVAANTTNMLQIELHCCGVHSYKDWIGVMPDNDIQNIPQSCCVMHNETGSCIQFKKAGCLSQLEFVIRESVTLLASTATIIALIQLIGVSFSCSLARMIRYQKTERDRQRWEMREQLISNYTQGEKGPVVYMTIMDTKPKT